MSRILTLAAVGLAIGAAATLYQVKYEVRLLEREARELHRNVARERQSIQVLEAEWAFLNQPSRIQDLAERYLDLKPLKPSQISTVERLPLRPVNPAPEGEAAPDPLIAAATPTPAKPTAGKPVATKPATTKPAATKPAAPAKPATTTAAAKPAPARPETARPIPTAPTPTAPTPVATAPAKPAKPVPAPEAAPTRPAATVPARPSAPPIRPAVPTRSASAQQDLLLDDVERVFTGAEYSYPQGRQ